MYEVENLDISKRIVYVIKTFGGVAQLARALEWHSRGRGFDSPHLHFCKEPVLQEGTGFVFLVGLP